MLDKTNYTDDGNTIRRLRRAPHLVTDLQRQYFEELQIQFQPGVGTSGLFINNPTYSPNPSQIVITPNQLLSIGPNDTLIIGFDSQQNQVDQTNNPQAMLRWSNDGGSTWSNEHWVSMGQLGKYKNRAIWRRLGWSRDRVFEVVVTDPVNAVIVSANLKAKVGTN